MKSELIVDVQPHEASIALTEDGRLVSLQIESRNLAYAVGDIYAAKVKKLMPGLNAAFVNVGYEKDAFLHYLDLGPHFSSYSTFIKELLAAPSGSLPKLQKMKLLPDIDKHGTITDQLTVGQELLVQIVKEPISSKGPRLTTEIAFTGRYMVLIPFSSKISISQKIKTTAEKLRLRHLVESIRPKNFGVIIRTSAEGKSVAELNREIQTLLQCWEETIAKARHAEIPSLIFEEESRIVGVLRDVFSPDFEAIHVNQAEAFAQIQKYVSLIAPEKKDIVQLYTKDTPIFDHFNITRQIKSSFGKTVSFKSGAYIIIEHTEALHVIDVNSGNRAKAGNDQEANALDVNLRAADEIARQLRLRDMGGIIVVDFIDMAKGEHRQQLYEHMKEVMANDRARHNILPLSKFGLMQITRQRVRPVLDITTTETCPSCFGKGEIQPSLLFTDTLYEKLHYMIDDLGIKDFTLYVHPYVEAYLRKGWLSSLYRRWRRNLGVRFGLVPDQSLAYLQYRVVDKEGNAIDLKQEKDTQQSSVAKTRRRQDAARAEAEDAAPEKAEKAKKPKAEKPGKTAKASETPKSPKKEKKSEKTSGTDTPNVKTAPAETSDASAAAPAASAPAEARITAEDDASSARSDVEAKDKPGRNKHRRRSSRARKQAAAPTSSENSENSENSEKSKTSKKSEAKPTASEAKQTSTTASKSADDPTQQ